jgi:hypothetical protein
MPNAIRSLVSLQEEVYLAVCQRHNTDDSFINCPGLAELMFACIQPRSNYPADDRADGYTVVGLGENSILLEVLTNSFEANHRVWRHIRRR